MNPKHLSGLAALMALATLPFPAMAADVEPWKTPENAIVIDAYELNEIDWSEMLSDKRIAGFISKASDGLPESYSCKGEHSGDTVAHCKTMWRKYAVSRELYETRRLLARSKGLLWGAYHLARPDNPIDQANHFLDYAKPQDDEMMVLDIEGIDPDNYRLGYGGGFYDRTLAAMPRKPLVIGIGYELQRIPTIYPQQYDIPMDRFVSEAFQA